MMSLRRMTPIATLSGLLGLTIVAAAGAAQEFHSAWPEDATRVWVGPEYWANRLQDWRIAGGRLECVESRPTKPMRTVHLLTRCLGKRRGVLQMSVRTGVIEGAAPLSEQTWSGFLIGAGGQELDYRAAALVHHSPGRGGGLIAAINGRGELVFRDNTDPTRQDALPLLTVQSRQGSAAPRRGGEDIELRLEAAPTGSAYTLTLSAHDHATSQLLGRVTLGDVEPQRLVGNVALVSHVGPQQGGARYWFRDWQVSGSKVERHDERRFGPILCAQHTLSDGTLKITAQLPPLGADDTPTARLDVRYSGDEPWQVVASEKIVAPGWTVPFRVEKWDSSRDAQYRIVYSLREPGGESTEYQWRGRIRRDPVDKRTVVVAAFTGNSNCGSGADRARGANIAARRWTLDNIWFPHADIVRHVKAHRPDLLVFTGDQVYNSNSPTATERTPEDKAQLDYLYKWYLWCWAYADLVRDTPVVCLPDDHDVFHGNIWGWSGRKSPEGNQNNGGYLMSPEFVNIVQRTQTSHLPDPYDPTPVEQGIGVYYTAMNYGGISFAVLEDRKFKSPPTLVQDAEIRDGHIMTPDYDPKNADVPGATLLGDRQLKFLRDWAADWRGASMKVALSQTLFANLQTREGRLDKDLDSNAWPQSGRKRALHELRRGFAFMICGDQHLGSIIHHGIDEWNEAGYSLCVPSIANYYPRFWEPAEPGRNRKPGMPAHTGEFLDGLGNRITVWAVANPKRPQQLTDEERARRPLELHRKAPGYGIVRLSKNEGTITIECWPRHAGPKDRKAQYPGWPLTIRMEDNYGREPAAYLPTLKFSGIENPVVQVIDEMDDDIVYTLRVRGTSFRPKVFRRGTYTVRIGEPGTPGMRILNNVHTVRGDEKQVISVRF